VVVAATQTAYNKEPAYKTSEYVSEAL
jgi:hypothetical protein